VLEAAYYSHHSVQRPYLEFTILAAYLIKNQQNLKTKYTLFLKWVKGMKYQCLVCYYETVTIFTYSMRYVKEAIPPKTLEGMICIKIP
jgi:hypothetical protein